VDATKKRSVLKKRIKLSGGFILLSGAFAEAADLRCSTQIKKICRQFSFARFAAICFKSAQALACSVRDCAAPTALCFSSIHSQHLPLQRAKRASGRASLRPSGSVWVETQTYKPVVAPTALGFADAIAASSIWQSLPWAVVA
jgi:hypothetical protein